MYTLGSLTRTIVLTIFNPLNLPSKAIESFGRRVGAPLEGSDPRCDKSEAIAFSRCMHLEIPFWFKNLLMQ